MPAIQKKLRLKRHAQYRVFRHVAFVQTCDRIAAEHKQSTSFEQTSADFETSSTVSHKLASQIPEKTQENHF